MATTNCNSSICCPAAPHDQPSVAPNGISHLVKDMLGDMQTRLQTMTEAIVNSNDSMDSKIDDLEKSLEDLMLQQTETTSSMPTYSTGYTTAMPNRSSPHATLPRGPGASPPMLKSPAWNAYKGS
eukprot:GHVS01054380.1.p1 GENE.GHVS01054380.1~~GHVS01054380.1.p1  ORF type:complete len:125 (+),score=13.64 GHVS01054380.1:116-490(+)